MGADGHGHLSLESRKAYHSSPSGILFTAPFPPKVDLDSLPTTHSIFQIPPVYLPSFNLKIELLNKYPVAPL